MEKLLNKKVIEIATKIKDNAEAIVLPKDEDVFVKTIAVTYNKESAESIIASFLIHFNYIKGVVTECKKEKSFKIQVFSKTHNTDETNLAFETAMATFFAKGYFSREKGECFNAIMDGTKDKSSIAKGFKILQDYITKQKTEMEVLNEEIRDLGDEKFMLKTKFNTLKVKYDALFFTKA